MLEFAALSPTVQALVVTAIVLLQAVVLYLGYGLLTDALASRVFETIRGV